MLPSVYLEIKLPSMVPTKQQLSRLMPYALQVSLYILHKANFYPSACQLEFYLQNCGDLLVFESSALFETALLLVGHDFSA